jgi:hypothetical protein
MKVKTLRKLVTLCIYMLVFTLGIVLWFHDIKGALLNALLILWNLKSLQFCDQLEETEKNDAIFNK